MKKILLAFIFLFFISTLSIKAQTHSPDSLSVLQKVERWYGNNMNYLTITALMTVESSFIPFPSEVVIPPAAYIASNNDPEINKNNLNIFLVVVFGTMGAIIGALINYFLALWLGRPIIHKFADSKMGHLFLLSSEKITKAENYFNEHGKISTFIGRLIPGIRQLISIPAGLAKMNIASFVTYTALGAVIWNAVLALLGYIAHGQADLINQYSHEIGYIIMALVILIILYFVIKKLINKKTAKQTK